MILVTKTIDPSTGSETRFYQIERYPHVFNGRRCLSVDDVFRREANNDLNDLDGTLDLLGLEEVGHDDLRSCSYWAKRTAP